MINAELGFGIAMICLENATNGFPQIPNVVLSHTDLVEGSLSRRNKLVKRIHKFLFTSKTSLYNPMSKQ